MRKITRAITPALAVLLFATACGSDDGGTDAGAGEESPTTEETGAPVRGDADLVIWTDSGTGKLDALKKVAEPFGEANGITVEVQSVSADLQANFVTANAAGNGPDVVVGAHDWIGNLVQNGAIEPLQLTPDQLDGYAERAVDAGTFDGRLYGVPFGIEALVLYRNTDVVPDEPATFDEVIAAGRQAVKDGAVESALNLPVGELGDAYHMHPIYTSMGGYLFGTTADGGYDAGDVGVGKPGSVEAAKKIATLAKQKVLRKSISGDNSIALFTAGKAAFLVSGPWALSDVRTSGIPYAIQPIPGFAGQEPAEPFMGAQAFMVASQGQNKAFAQEFVNTGVNNTEAMTTMFEVTNLPPAMTAVQEGLEDEDVALFAEAANRGMPMPALPAMAAVWEPLGKAYAAIVGGADPAKTINGAGRTINDAISNQ